MKNVPAITIHPDITHFKTGISFKTNHIMITTTTAATRHNKKKTPLVCFASGDSLNIYIKKREV